ncbi:MAG: putative membrane protein/Uncharacterized membrane protein [Chloroflexi bacterium]|nr:MAG: putative membrane protein/Uncharacterized membrane protein [Chloroflexota bacterium]
MNTCKSCQKENSPDSQFCIFCGTHIDSISTSQTKPDDTEDLQTLDPGNDTSSLKEQLASLNSKFVHLESRILLLERSLTNKLGLVSEKPSPKLQKSNLPSKTSSLPKYQTTFLRKLVSVNWFAVIGSIILAIGIGFFIKAAFDLWIGPTGRIIVGIVAGIALIGVSEYASKRFSSWAQGLCGGGLAILYIAIYASFAFYELISPTTVFIILFFVVLLGCSLALRYNSKVIAFISLIGAFITPPLIETELKDQLYLAIGYILLIDIGIVAVASRKKWQWYTLLGLIGSYVVGGLMASELPDSEAIFSQLGLSGIFIIFIVATAIHNIYKRSKPDNFDFILIIGNAGIFFGLTMSNLAESYEGWLGLSTILLSLLYAAIGLFALRTANVSKLLSFCFLGISLIFLTAFIPVQLTGEWITVTWAAQSAVVIGIGLKFKDWKIRLGGLIVLSLAIIRALSVDTFSQDIYEDFTPVLNHRFLAFLICIIATYIAAYLYSINKIIIEEWETHVGLLLFAAATFMTIWLITAEIIDYFNSAEIHDYIKNIAKRSYEESKQLTITLFWAIYALLLIFSGIKVRTQVVVSPKMMTAFGALLLAVPIAKLFIHDVFLLDTSYRVAAFVVLGPLLIVTGLAYRKIRESFT